VQNLGGVAEVCCGSTESMTRNEYNSMYRIRWHRLRHLRPSVPVASSSVLKKLCGKCVYVYEVGAETGNVKDTVTKRQDD